MKRDSFASSLVRRFELNCYEYDRIKTELVESDGVKPERYWPRELYAAYRNR
jgi:hypothetical protein